MLLVLCKLAQIMISVGFASRYLLAKSMYFEASMQSSVSVLFHLQKILKG